MNIYIKYPYILTNINEVLKLIQKKIILVNSILIYNYILLIAQNQPHFKYVFPFNSISH